MFGEDAVNGVELRADEVTVLAHVGQDARLIAKEQRMAQLTDELKSAMSKFPPARFPIQDYPPLLASIKMATPGRKPN